jgi:hypothetical protein
LRLFGSAYGAIKRKKHWEVQMNWNLNHMTYIEMKSEKKGKRTVRGVSTFMHLVLTEGIGRFTVGIILLSSLRYVLNINFSAGRYEASSTHSHDKGYGTTI